ncbi:hypothetical protein RRG08_039670 [Elysia crispata]|uniref:Uncharacterized protein n=1 Tax=Elysia crispata TaxID=231223 RepID=A0AAE0YAC7_9GAST|nr:hypothetical protein RRG08_039670 [Elysia crispata]
MRLEPVNTSHRSTDLHNYTGRCASNRVDRRRFGGRREPLSTGYATSAASQDSATKLPEARQEMILSSYLQAEAL